MENQMKNSRLLLFTALGAAVVTIGVTALLTTIFEHRQEARNPFYRVVELSDSIEDPAVWGKNFPLQYDDYRKTVDMVQTRFGGSEALPRDPTATDPRSTASQSRLVEDARLVAMWKGYAFSQDFREERGHAYMLEDQMFTGRQQAAKQPGACIQCHASVYQAYRRAGNGDLMAGFRAVNPLPYEEARKLVSHPVACIDCHEPATMQLRVTRPGFLIGYQAYKASQGVSGYDVNRDATRQEMRTFVCGQCHVEYYFRGAEKELTYPWAKGLRVDSIYSYYDSTGHRDWIHETSGAPVLKAQHPEFETFNQGIHARSGVACADCHMPYRREGAFKISDHHVRSPLLNIANACQTCHKISEEELRERVYTIQDRTYETRNVAIDALLALIASIGRARQADSANPRIPLAQQYQRAAQFYTDFVEAENSMGFHADQESIRILASAINFTRLGEAALRGESVPLRPLDALAQSAHRVRARPAP
jgi:nitrite reductase (cytochrome c-552)